MQAFSLSKGIPFNIRITASQPLTGPSLACQAGCLATHRWNVHSLCVVFCALLPHQPDADSKRLSLQFTQATSIRLIWTRGWSNIKEFHDIGGIPGSANGMHVSQKATMGATFPRNYAGIDGVERAGGPAGGGAPSHRWRC